MALLGVDVGGTFTDFYFSREGQVEVYKRPSTPDDPSRAVIAGLLERAWQPDEVVHGSTIATNTVLQRAGARVAFIGTKGFRDLLTIGRQARPGLYDLEPHRPPPLVPRDLCFEADERVDYRGRVLRELKAAEAERLAGEVADSGSEGAAVCLLFSFLEPAHERLIAEALRAKGIEVSPSHEVLPEFREYERAMTTALNAYVGPAVRQYLTELEARLSEAGCDRLRILQSSGGVASAEQAAARPASLLLSGPAGGVAGAFATGRAAGFERLVSFDMGGTSTDVALCDGSVPYTTEWSVSGLPLRLPSVDVHTVGAGGGSVAWLDAGGALRVGPRSAGAEPGPACYKRGGPATVTDAHLLLGRLSEDGFLGGSLAVDRKAAGAALRELGPAPEEGAKGTIAVANSGMERALRVVSVERGYDPRDFTLVAFGGAGPLHACDVADALSMPRVLVPRYPGILSAIGMALADVTKDASVPLISSLAADEGPVVEAKVAAALEEMGARLGRELGPATEFEQALDMRYAGQGYELTVPWQGNLTRTLAAFYQAHERRYGHSSARTVEITVARVRGRVRREAPKISETENAASGSALEPSGERMVVFDRERQTALYERRRLRAGHKVEGPAIVTQADSTTLVPPGWVAEVDAQGNLIIERRSNA